MILRALHVACVCGAILAEPAIAQSPRPQEASDLVGTFGTAFFVSTNGQALTNAHVVEGCEEVHVDLEGRPGAARVVARVVARDEKNDLALLATDLHPVQGTNWRLSVRQGEDIVVYGFPLTGVLASGGNVVTGNVSALAGIGGSSPMAARPRWPTCAVSATPPSSSSTIPTTPLSRLPGQPASPTASLRSAGAGRALMMPIFLTGRIDRAPYSSRSTSPA